MNFIRIILAILVMSIVPMSLLCSPETFWELGPVETGDLVVLLLGAASCLSWYKLDGVGSYFRPVWKVGGLIFFLAAAREASWGRIFMATGTDSAGPIIPGMSDLWFGTYIHITVGILILILLYMMSVLIYMKEKPNIKWNTGEVSIFEQKMILPIGVKEFEEKNQIEIKEIDENNFAEVKLGESTILLYIKDEQIKGLKIDLNSISQSDIDKIKFPSNVSLNNSIEEVKETYKTGNVNIFMKKYNEKAIESENIHIDRYIGQKYNIEIRSIGNKIQSILYVYKY